jgi:peptide/nickel transport system substrate-binding protein
MQKNSYIMKYYRDFFHLIISLVLFGLITACFPEQPNDPISGTGAPPLPVASPAPGTSPPQATGRPAATTQPTSESTLQATQPPYEKEETPEPVSLWSPPLRQAIAAAIDREALVDWALEGRGDPAYHLIPTGSPFFSDPFFIEYGTRDLQRSTSLLQELGYTSEVPFQLDLWYPIQPQGSLLLDILDVIQLQLEETGLIEVNLQPTDWEIFSQQMVLGEMPFYLLGWRPDFIDPENWISPFLSCQLSSSQGIGYCNSELDALLEVASTTFNQEARKDIYKQIGEHLAAQAPVVPLYWEPEFLAFRQGVDGVETGPDMVLDYRKLSFSEEAVPASGSTDTLIIGSTNPAHQLDPQTAIHPSDIEILINTGALLMRFEPGEFAPFPAAAAEYPEVVDDNKTYIFTLRRDLRFADGTPLEAQHYIEAWQRLLRLENAQADLFSRYIQSVEALDEHTIAYQLTGGYSFFNSMAATAPLMPLNPTLYDSAEPVSLPDRLDGAGPYFVETFEPGSDLYLVANPSYKGAQSPAVANIIVRYYPDAAHLGAALESGDVDIAWRSLGLTEAFRLENVSGISVNQIQSPILHSLIFNHSFIPERK